MCDVREAQRPSKLLGWDLQIDKLQNVLIKCINRMTFDVAINL